MGSSLMLILHEPDTELYLKTTKFVCYTIRGNIYLEKDNNKNKIKEKKKTQNTIRIRESARSGP